MMRLLGIVILFHPSREVLENIDSYISGVDTLLVWSNSILSKEFLQDLKTRPVLLLGNQQNEGIGKALNEAVGYALNQDYTHLLTMDQDSSFEESAFLTYREEINLNKDSNIGCFTPNHGWNTIDPKTGTIKSTITSGSVYPVRIFHKTGLFRSDFFIDGIDTEFSLRLRNQGYSIHCVDSVRMNHHLGNSTQFHIGRFKFSSINYPPLRTYYILRNHTLIRKMYKEYREEKGFYKFFVFRRFIQIILLESDKRAKLKAMFWGLIHGYSGKTGICKVKL